MAEREGSHRPESYTHCISTWEKLGRKRRLRSGLI